MADPETLQQAFELLEELIGADPDRRAQPGDPSALRALLALRLARAADEAEEVRRTSDGASPGRVDVRRVSRELFHQDLCVSAPTVPGGRMLSECTEIVLCRAGATGLSLPARVRRRYAILDGAGRQLGEVHQIADEAAGTAAAIADQADLHLHLLDRTIGQTFSFRRAGDQLYIFDELGSQLGFVHFKPGEAPATFKVISGVDRGMMPVRTEPERPYTLHISDNIGEEIGRVERRFVGPAAFLEDTNRMRISLEPGRASPAQVWGLIAAAMLAGLDDEAS